MALRTRDEFLSAAAHDLKTPLAGIKGTTQLLHRRAARLEVPDGARLAEGLASIDRNATRMAGLINELMDITRLQMGRPLPLDLTQVDLVTLARRSVEEHQVSSERHRLRVEAAVPELVGRWDAQRLLRVLDNLLGNAIKYSPNGVVVGVARQEADEPGSMESEGLACTWAVLSVADEGVGVTEADLPHIFERFHRAANVRGISGTGIGLASARHIVASHGGTMEVRSREGGRKHVRHPAAVNPPVNPPVRPRGGRLRAGHSTGCRKNR